MIKLPDGTEIEIMDVTSAFEMAIKAHPLTADLPLTKGPCTCGCGRDDGYEYPPTAAMFQGFQIGLKFMIDQNMSVTSVTDVMRDMRAANNGTKH